MTFKTLHFVQGLSRTPLLFISRYLTSLFFKKIQIGTLIGLPMGSHGSPCQLGSHGFPWVPMGPHGSPWVPMGSHGFPWVPIGPMGPHGVPVGPPWPPWKIQKCRKSWILKIPLFGKTEWSKHGVQFDAECVSAPFCHVKTP